MTGYAKPRVVVSRCLGFDACRYDGAMISYEFNSIALPDHQEGATALLEKRAPKFQGLPISE